MIKTNNPISGGGYINDYFYIYEEKSPGNENLPDRRGVENLPFSPHSSGSPTK
jgi:hypothetical protein